MIGAKSGLHMSPSEVSFVINYDAPKEISVYVHRIGRTGRIGHRGTALTYITMEDSRIYIYIYRYYWTCITVYDIICICIRIISIYRYCIYIVL